VARFDGAVNVDVEWRSFQLNPQHPAGAAEPLETHLARKTGIDEDQVRAMNDRVVALAAAEGLDYHFETYRVVNTFDAHRVLQLAKAHGLGTEAHERLLCAQLVEGELFEDPATLVRLAVEVGVPEDAARAVVAGDAFTDEVRGDLREAAALGISGVPFYVVDRAYGVSGAQAADLLLEVLETVAAERAPG
jgi:predicted DsbA family dithiol-disulfide isomerase